MSTTEERKSSQHAASSRGSTLTLSPTIQPWAPIFAPMMDATVWLPWVWNDRASLLRVKFYRSREYVCREAVELFRIEH